ncbi:MAG: hypothetical protein P4L99_24675 [Chthoniobacter sp.]|nr:hypothetical protein [Chthoniobacter sp.]
MPPYSRLFRRAATYYFRVGVPEVLRPAIGKREILKSLRTTNYHEAKRLVAFESATADALFEREAAPNAREEVVLNNNDNWIPQSERLDAFTNPLRWARHLRTYITEIPVLFERELARAQQIVPLVLTEREEQTLNLQLAESYWEFSSENPTALVANLVPLFQSFSSRNRETSHFRQDFDSSIDHNALSLFAEVNPGRALRIYAKTNRRIRIEVIHSFGGRFGYQFPGGHTLEAWSALPRLLNDLAEDAAELVNRLFLHFRGQSEVTPSHISSYQLLLEICREARDLPTATHIASILIHVGPVAAEGNGTRVQRALQRLAQANVIEYNRQASNYTVTAPRRHALEMLRRNGNFSFLVARRRTRQGGEN